LQSLTDKVEKLTTKNAGLQEQVSKLKTQLSGVVLQQEWESLRTEYNNLRKHLDAIATQKDKTASAVTNLEREKNKLMEDIVVLKKELSEKDEEVSKLQTYQNFWRSRANSMHKILTQTNPTGSIDIINGTHPHVQKNNWKEKKN